VSRGRTTQRHCAAAGQTRSRSNRDRIVGQLAVGHRRRVGLRGNVPSSCLAVLAKIAYGMGRTGSRGDNPVNALPPFVRTSSCSQRAGPVKRRCRSPPLRVNRPLVTGVALLGDRPGDSAAATPGARKSQIANRKSLAGFAPSLRPALVGERSCLARNRLEVEPRRT